MIPVDLSQNNAAMPINMFLHPDANGNGKPAMVGMPGYTIQDSEGTNLVKGCARGLTYNYWVINASLYQSLGTPISLTLSEAGWFTITSIDPTSMAVSNDYVAAVQESGNQLAWKKISDNTDGNVDTATLNGMNDPTQIIVQDGFFLMYSRNGNAVGFEDTFYISALNNPTSWSSIDFEDADYKADKIAGMVSFKQIVFIFGEYTCEPYQNVGNSDFPFERISSGVFDVGCLAPYSIQECNNDLYWLGHDASVWSLDGFVPRKVSSPLLNNILGSYTTLTDAIGWTFLVDGMWFYALKFPTEGETYALNTTTGLWTKYMSGTDGTTNHPGTCSMAINGKNYIGLNTGGSVALLDISIYSENTAAIHKELETQIIDANRERMFFGPLELWAKEAVGSASVNPTISVDYSDNMRSTWSTARTLSLGKSDGSDVQLRIPMAGSSLNRIFRFKSSNIYELMLYGGYLE